MDVFRRPHLYGLIVGGAFVYVGLKYIPSFDPITGITFFGAGYGAVLSLWLMVKILIAPHGAIGWLEHDRDAIILAMAIACGLTLLQLQAPIKIIWGAVSLAKE
jgi:hypothetical protein